MSLITFIDFEISLNDKSLRHVKFPPSICWDDTVPFLLTTEPKLFSLHSVLPVFETKIRAFSVLTSVNCVQPDGLSWKLCLPCVASRFIPPFWAWGLFFRQTSGTKGSYGNLDIRFCNFVSSNLTDFNWYFRCEKMLVVQSQRQIAVKNSILFRKI